MQTTWNWEELQRCWRTGVQFRRILKDWEAGLELTGWSLSNPPGLMIIWLSIPALDSPISQTRPGGCWGRSEGWQGKGGRERATVRWRFKVWDCRQLAFNLPVQRDPGIIGSQKQLPSELHTPWLTCLLLSSPHISLSLLPWGLGSNEIPEKGPETILW